MANRHELRSAASQQLLAADTVLFSLCCMADPTVWNSLSDELRTVTSRLQYSDMLQKALSF